MNWIERRIREAAEKQLTELDLSGNFAVDEASSDNFTELPAEVLKLTHLRKLDLSYQPLRELPKELAALTNLTELSLSGGHYSCKVASGLAGLKNLVTLRMAPCEDLADVDFSRLAHLEKLDLGFRPIAGLRLHLPRLRELAMDCPELGWLHELTTLRKLTLRSLCTPGSLAQLAQHIPLKALVLYKSGSASQRREISLFDGLEQLRVYELPDDFDEIPEDWLRLSRLEGISLSRPWTGRRERKGSWRLANLDQLVRLSSLRDMSLDGIDARSVVQILPTSLKCLKFIDAGLSEFPQRVLDLTQLEELNLASNEIRHLSGDIAKLIGLKRLNLSGNPLTDLPEGACELKSLEVLWLPSTKLRRFPPVDRLPKLTQLSVARGIHIEHFPAPILRSSHLEYLNLGGTGIRTIPNAIERLTNLVDLELGENQLLELPAEIGRLPRLKRLGLHGNGGLTSPPPEVVARGTAAIQTYFTALEAKTTRLFEAKLIVVGEGRVGKTCVVRKLLNDAFSLDQHDPEDDTTRGIGIEKWPIETDLAANFRVNVWDFGGQEIYHATHQFFLTKRSLYLFVWDAQKEDRVEGFDYWLSIVTLLSGSSPILVVMNKADVRTREIDQAGLQRKFPNIVGFFKVSVKSGYGFPELRQEICSRVAHLPHVGTTWPDSWTQVRTQLEAQSSSANYTDAEDYLKICQSEGIEGAQASVLSGYLHDLGVVLHFADDPILSNTVILKPDWGTNAVYSVLDAKPVHETNGRFSFREFAAIWGHKGYPAAKHPHLLQLMTKFELCFELEGQKAYITPELLPPSRPAFEWSDASTLGFEYRYEFMPAGIITRFMARNHAWIEGENYWRTGTLLAWEGCRALVVSWPLERRISIRVAGRDAQNLLAMIRRDLAHIHKTLNDPVAQEFIPCACGRCQGHAAPERYDYHFLVSNDRAGIPELACRSSMEKVSIKKMLTGILPLEEARPTAAQPMTLKLQLESPLPPATLQDMVGGHKQRTLPAAPVPMPWLDALLVIIAPALSIGWITYCVLSVRSVDSAASAWGIGVFVAVLIGLALTGRAIEKPEEPGSWLKLVHAAGNWAGQRPIRRWSVFIASACAAALAFYVGPNATYQYRLLCNDATSIQTADISMACDPSKHLQLWSPRAVPTADQFDCVWAKETPNQRAKPELDGLAGRLVCTKPAAATVPTQKPEPPAAVVPVNAGAAPGSESRIP
jgi:internalin A